MSQANEDNQLSPLKQAFLKLEEMDAKLKSIESARTEPIAVIGIGCRFPGKVNDPDSLWELLRNGVDAISEVPPSRWDINAFYDPDKETPGKMATRYGGFIDGVDEFDPGFFGISPREAKGLDPQQRLLLEVSWEALENAGYADQKLENSRTGVYFGLCTHDYENLRLRQKNLSGLDVHYASGIACSIASGRLSYFLGLHGPSVSIDTACSSSLVALHLACQSLRSKETNMALAGGSNIILLPDNTIAMSRAGMMAPDGRCKTFDASADGFIRSEGCGVVVLKRLSDSIADGDNIYAVVRASAVNHDGPSSGLTVPNGPAQEEVIRDALKNAGVDPLDVGYVECHGTGTSLGDPIEVNSLMNVYCQNRSEDQPLLIGSVKTNIGHLEAAAGIAGLIKAVLVLRHQQIPPHLHFETPNPHIEWHRAPVKVTATGNAWNPATGKRLAGVSSFGFSGTNAHVILEEAPATEPARNESERPYHLLCLSAKQSGSLKELAAKYRKHLTSIRTSRPQESAIGDICYTANGGRSHFSHRLAIVADNIGTIGESIEAFCSGKSLKKTIVGQLKRVDPPEIAFLFTGQGSQYPQMGRLLYETQPVFRRAMDRCSEILASLLDVPFLSVIFSQDGCQGRLDQTVFTQPALFSLEYSLTQLWRSWGIEPSVVVGHSVGEYVAACIAGVFSVEDGLRLIAERGRLIQEMTPEGRMIAVFASEECVRELLLPYEGIVSIAAVNGPENVVVSGEPEAVESIVREMVERGLSYQRLNVSRGFHSPLMDPMLDTFEKIASSVPFAHPEITLISNVTGRPADRDKLNNSQYWREHIRRPVQFCKTLQTLDAIGCNVLVETGPSPVLLGMAKQFMRSPQESNRLWLPSLRRGYNDWQQMLETLGALYVAGAMINWPEIDRGYARRHIPLPTYSFSKKPYWYQDPSSETLPEQGTSDPTGPSNVRQPLVGSCIRSPLVKEILFQSRFSQEAFPLLADHRIFDQIVVPATAYLEMAVGAYAEVNDVSCCSLEDIVICNPLIIAEGEIRTVQLILVPNKNGYVFEIISFADGGSNPSESWQKHASGNITGIRDAEGTDAGMLVSEEVVRSRCTDGIDAQAFYENLEQRGMHFGSRFQGLQSLYRCKGEAWGRIVIPGTAVGEIDLFRFHPGVFDACLQPFAGCCFSEEELGSGDVIYMPIGIEGLSIIGAPQMEMMSHFVLRDCVDDQTLVADAQVYGISGKPIMSIRGMSFRKVNAEMLGAKHSRIKADYHSWLYERTWIDKSPAMVCMPSPADLLPMPKREEFIARSRVGSKNWDSVMSGLDTLSTKYILKAFQSLGWHLRLDDEVTAGNLLKTMGIAHRHTRLFHRMLAILEEDGYLKRSGGGWSVVKTPSNLETDDDVAEVRRSFPDFEAELTFLSRSGHKLAKNLCLDNEPLETLFPGGSFGIANMLYRKSPAAITMNSMVRQTVERVLELMPKGRRLRILEVGAGTGGTTSFVVPVLPEDRIEEYVFSDVSNLFLARAEEEFHEYGFMRYRLVDIEADPATQGLPLNSFDLVIAANVIHATSDLRISLRHVRQLLSNQGLVILLEGTSPVRWIDLSFGLTEGWWKFTDTDTRPSYPLIKRDEWIELLQENGFPEVVSIPEQIEKGVMATNAMLLARTSIIEDPHAAGKATTDEIRDWILFADADGLGIEISNRLASLGHRCFVVSAGDEYHSNEPRRYIIDPLNQDHYRLVLESLRDREKVPRAGILHLWSLHKDPGSSPDGENILVAQNGGCRSILLLLQALSHSHDFATAGLWLFTAGAQAVTDDQETVNVTHSPVWGLAKVISLEHPDLKCIRVDLDPSIETDRISMILDAIRTDDGEQEIAYRKGVRKVARLTRSSCSLSEADSSAEISDIPSRLVVSTPGVLDSIAFVPTERKHPAQNEVEVEVKATGLNFRDVLIALGMYPGGADSVGGECSGTISAIGDNVDHFKVGDAVIAMAPSGFDDFAITDARLVVPKPQHLSWEDAASILSCYMTAYFTLMQLSGIKKGDRVLIHSAAGGVGLAAVFLAQMVGSEVYATAGNHEKRDYIRSLGVEHVMDSRSLAFADEIMAKTDGQGVDIVLNSLSGEYIEKSMAVVGRNGKFVEIGKRDIWSEQKVDEVREDVDYFIVDLAKTSESDPDDVGEVLHRVMDLIGQGRLPVLPKRVFSRDHVIQAFRYMAQARHIGKIVVSREEHGSTSQPTDSISQSAHAQLKAEASYLIVGGLSGIGLRVAEWMVSGGARHLFLMGRSAPPDEAQSAIKRMEQSGATVAIIRGDVSKADDVRDALEKIHGSKFPLKGIIHSAGVLADGVLLLQDWSRFEQVMAPKVVGAWHLHFQTRHIPLDFFVLFSSIASLLGSPGQGNHAAANEFLDTLAHYRRLQGLPALSINWGAWSEIGAAARRNVGDRIGIKGIDVFTPEQGLKVLGELLGSQFTEVGVMPVRWPAFLGIQDSDRSNMFFERFYEELEKSRPSFEDRKVRESEPDLLLDDLTKLPEQKRMQVLKMRIRELATKVLGLENSDGLDDMQPLQELGLDSLMAVELRNLLKTSFRLEQPLSATLIFDYPTISQLAAHISEKVANKDSHAEKQLELNQPQTGNDLITTLDEVERLSEDEVERLFSEEGGHGKH
jgi:acyl transferase domain-containing protein/acyl carrier protein